MRVLLVGGGTAGHINPALAIAGALKEKAPDAAFLFAGVPTGMEYTLVPKAGFEIAPIEVMGFYRGIKPRDISHNLKALKCLTTAGSRAKKIIRDFAPDIVIGTGGYVSGPVVLAAQKLGIPTLIHEQNAFPGVTNKLLSRRADAICLAVERAKEHMELPEGARVIVTGNPVRAEIMQKTRAKARQELHMDDAPCILSFGGSLGAREINRIAADLIAWHAPAGKINHIHAYGKFGKDQFPRFLAERGIDPAKYPRLDIRPYIDNMDACLAAADLVVCRAGAITLSELEVTGKASVLIPSPNVAENHQYHNAKVLADHGAAILVEEAKYDRDALLSEMEQLFSEPDALQRLGEKARELAITDTTDRICDEVFRLTEKTA